MEAIFTDQVGIHFINRIENEQYYIYDVEIENVKGSAPARYDLSGLYCNNGTNVLDTDDFDLSLIEGKTLLLEGEIPTGTTRDIGVIAFKKDIQNVNDNPVFEYEEISVNTYSSKITT